MISIKKVAKAADDTKMMQLTTLYKPVESSHSLALCVEFSDSQAVEAMRESS